MEGDELAEAIGESVNGGINSADFQEALRREHNHLQEKAYYEVIRPAVVSLANTEQVDARNEQAVTECREIAEKMGWEY